MSISTARETGVHQRDFPVLLTTTLVSSLIMLDSNIVAVSLPAMGRALGASFTDIQWVISAYMLTYAALLLASGNYADLYGRRKAMLIGLVIFAISSAACGAAHSAWFLNLARAIQGVGGALLLTASMAILSHEFRGEERLHAFAFWGAALGIALAIGPVVGGLITRFFGWRWVFLVNPPICALLVIAVLRTIAESRDPDAKALDLPGIVTFSLGLALLIWALIDGNDIGWGASEIVLRLGGSVILFVAFVVVELSRRHAMVDFTLFKRRTLLGAIMAMFGYGASAQVMIFFLPLFLQNAYGFEPAVAGFAMIPFALPMVVVPRLITKFGRHCSGRRVLCTGLAITVAGNLLFWAVAGANLSYPIFVIAMLVAGCGAGILNGQTVKVLSSAVPENRAGMASGLASTTRFVAILLAVAGLGAVLSNRVHLVFAPQAQRAGLDRLAADAAARRVASGDLAGVLTGMPGSVASGLHNAGLEAFAQGFAAAGLLAACVAAAACILTWLLISETETAPSLATARTIRDCAIVDCRDPL
jgi:EmrB/QacA subfamily drug resistance transporter